MKMPRITVSLTEGDIKKLEKVISNLDLSSPGQLMRFLLSGDVKRIDWIVSELKKL